MFKFNTIFILLFFYVLTAFGSDEIKTIAFAQDTLANDYRKAQVYEVRDAAARHPNITFVYSDAKGQTSLLIRQIRHFIDIKVDLIIIGTNDEKAVVPIISQAYKSNIPVIILDRGIQGSDYTAFIHSDNLQIGALGAKYVAERIGKKGKVLLFEGIQTADVTQLRSKGFMNEIRKFPAIKVIKRTGNYLRKDAIIEMEKLIASGEKIDAIFSESDSMLSGARTAMEHNGIDPSSIISVGCDYTSEAREAILNGKQSGSILFPLGGKKSLETALQVLHGKKVPKNILIPVKLITKQNADKEAAIF